MLYEGTAPWLTPAYLEAWYCPVADPGLLGGMLLYDVTPRLATQVATGLAGTYPKAWCPNGVLGCTEKQDFWGPGTTSVMGWSNVADLLRANAQKEWAGEWWRGNELGFLINDVGVSVVSSRRKLSTAEEVALPQGVGSSDPSRSGAPRPGCALVLGAHRVHSTVQC